MVFVATDTSYLDYDLLKSAYSDLKNNVPGENEINVFTELYSKLSSTSTKHDNYLQNELSELDIGNGNSLASICQKANESYNELLSALVTACSTSSANEGGSVDTRGVSGGVSTGGAGSSSGYYGGNYTVDPYTPTETPEVSLGSVNTPYFSTRAGTSAPTTSTPTTSSYRDVSPGGRGTSTSGGSIHTGASIGAGGALGSALVGGLGSASAPGEGVLLTTNYPLGNYNVNGSFIDGLPRDAVVKKLTDLGFTDEEIDSILNGEYDVSKVLVDEVSEKLAEAYKLDSGIRDYLKEQYGFDIFNEDGSVNNDKLSLALYMDDKSGLDNYSIISTLNEKYGISMVDMTTMKSYIGQFESMFMKDSKVRDKFKEQYGFDIFNPDGTVNKDRLALAMLIDEKSNGKYSISKFLKEAEASSLVNSLGNNMTKVANTKSPSGSKLPYVVGAAAVGAAAVGAGIAINKKKDKHDDETDGQNRFIINDLDYQEEDDDWVHNIIDSELDQE